MRWALAGSALAAGVWAVAAFAAADGPLRDTRTEREKAAEEVAQALNARERALDRREATIGEREAELKATEGRLEARLAELEQMRDDIDRRREEEAARDTQELVALVKMVEGMRGGDAGPVVAELDDALAVDVLRKMAPTRAARVLAAMEPERAAALAGRLGSP